jgi:hypothetical protein
MYVTSVLILVISLLVSKFALKYSLALSQSVGVLGNFIPGLTGIL